MAQEILICHALSEIAYTDSICGYHASRQSMLVSRDRPQRAAVECPYSVVPSINNCKQYLCQKESGKAVLPLWEPKESGNLACRVNKQITQDAHVQASPRCRISASLFADSIHSRRVPGEDEARDANTQYIRRL